MVTAEAPLERSRGALAALLVPAPVAPGLYALRRVDYPWPAVYGGQLVAQAVAAAAAFAPGRAVLSLHTSFLRAVGDEGALSVTIERRARIDDVEVLVAEVTAGGIVAVRVDLAMGPVSMMAETDRPAEGPRWGEGTLEAPAAVSPLADFLGLLEVRTSPTGDSGVAEAWIRAEGDLGLDLGQAVVAFGSDAIAADPVMRLQPDAPTGPPWPLTEWVSASLDHHMWFHRWPDPHDWHHTRLHCLGIAGGRGLAVGSITDSLGRPVASVAQEHLVRRRADAPAMA